MNGCVYDFQEKEEMEERLESSGESHLVLTTSHGLSEWDVRSLLVDIRFVQLRVF